LPSIHPAPHTQTCDFFQPFGTLWSKLKKNNMAKKKQSKQCKRASYALCATLVDEMATGWMEAVNVKTGNCHPQRMLPER